MSAIEWTNETWNPVAGCTPVSPGCLNCYAARMSVRLAGMGVAQYLTVDGKPIADTREGSSGIKRPVFNGTVNLVEDKLTDPLRWRKPRMVFVNSMSDLFHEAVPFEVIDRVFAVMALCPQHTFQILTKRPERMRAYLVAQEHGLRDRIGMAAQTVVSEDDWPSAWGEVDSAGWPLPNVWLGTSVENQSAARVRIPHLLGCPAVVRFLSCEPLLGPVDLRLGRKGDMRCRAPYLHWVIAGGESGPGARPMDPDWARSLRDQCVDAGVPFFFKQWGGVRKKTAGRVLDGWTWDEFPAAV
ncbi:MAG: phage Gp37/Gp68 family protein [Planctomycetota bacterium]